MKYGLIGDKLGHSFSKEIHKRLGEYEYEPHEVSKDELHAFMMARDFLGINVTLPHKQAVIPYLDWIHGPAEEIGAINVIINRCGRLYGYNTDYNGMRALITEKAKIDVEGKKAAILGSGGTSKTAYVVLRSLGAREILRVSRSGRDGAITYEELYEKHNDVEIIVNTTPVGMYPNIFGCPVDLTRLEQVCGVIDAVYNPINTTLVQRARERGIAAESGLYMLVAQAAVASELFLDECGNAHPSVIEGVYSEISRAKENILLIGMPASGKTTVGRIIAESLGREFIDTDELIENRIGMPISDFFARHGEADFRDIESQVIGEIANRNSLVIATGGGAVLREENVSALKYNGRIYFIDRPLKDLVPTESRPLSNSIEALKRRYAERYPLYLKVCDERIEADRNADEVAEKILEKYR